MARRAALQLCHALPQELDFAPQRGELVVPLRRKTRECAHGAVPATLSSRARAARTPAWPVTLSILTTPPTIPPRVCVHRHNVRSGAIVSDPSAHPALAQRLFRATPFVIAASHAASRWRMVPR